MSLLMDALKKAETTKRQAAGNPDVPRGRPFDDDALEADLARMAESASPRRSSPLARTIDDDAAMAAERLAAQNVFGAKQPPAAFSPFRLMLGLAALVALGIAAYFWWQLRSLDATPAYPQGSASPVTRAGVPAADAPSAPLPASPSPASPSLPQQASAAQRPSSVPDAVPKVPDDAPARASTRLASPTRPTDVSSSPAADSAAPPRVRPASRTDKKRLASPGSAALPQIGRAPNRLPLAEAYAALQADRTDAARKLYLQVLAGNRHNTDALLGLATIALREGKLAEAQSFYQRVLESDPTDATAQAALANLNGPNGYGDPGLTEARLKTALAGQPDSAALNFALGNLYARQQRWSEAQQAYFGAFSLAPDNPDYVFNLAVSLDHLHQKKLAAQYYQLAANLAQDASRVSFDWERAKRRALELQP